MSPSIKSNGRAGGLSYPIVALLALCLAVFGSRALAQGELIGLGDIATEITEQTHRIGIERIALMPLTHTDRTCSELSNYLVDQLTARMVRIDRANRPALIERTRLEAIFEELGITDILDPDTSSPIGTVYGVDAIMVGSLTPFSESVEISAVITDVETGEIQAAASGRVPMTDTVRELLSRPVTSGPICGSRDTVGGAPAPGAPPRPDAMPAAAPLDFPPLREVENSGIRTAVLFVGRDAESGATTISARLTNTTEEPVHIAIIGPSPTAVDTAGITHAFSSVSGLGTCASLEQHRTDECFSNWNNYLPGSSFTQVGPSQWIIANFTFTAPKPSPSEFMTVSFTLASQFGEPPGRERSLRAIGVSLPPMRITASAAE